MLGLLVSLVLRIAIGFVIISTIVRAIEKVLVFIANNWETVFEPATLACLKVIYSVGAVWHLITTVCSNVINVIHYIYYAGMGVFLFMEKTVIIFGSGVGGVWHFITTIPSGVIEAINSIYYAGICVFVYMIMKIPVNIIFGPENGILNTLISAVLCYVCMFTTFIPKFYEELCGMWCSAVASVPNVITVEYVGGLIIIPSLAYIFIKFHAIIGIYLKQQARKIRAWVMGKLTTIRNAVMPVQQNMNNQSLSITERSAQKETPMPQRHPIRNSPQKNLLSEDRKCVICQEQIKCILLLPCRHLCLCTECIQELTYYDDMCPICGTNIASTMKIFV